MRMQRIGSRQWLSAASECTAVKLPKKLMYPRLWLRCLQGPLREPLQDKWRSVPCCRPNSQSIEWLALSITTRPSMAKSLNSSVNNHIFNTIALPSSLCNLVACHVHGRRIVRTVAAFCPSLNPTQNWDRCWWRIVVAIVCNHTIVQPVKIHVRKRSALQVRKTATLEQRFC